LEVKINNNGTANLRVSAITLSDLNNFTLNLAGGTNPCNATNPTIAAGGTCTFEVGFEPAVGGTFAATVQIRSNDGTTPTFSLALSGISEAVQTLTVRINQVETGVCPATTAYVSVTDQGGYPLIGLAQGNFTSVDKNVTSQLPLTGFNFVSQVFAPVSIVTVMDYSGSQTDTPDVISDMEQGLLPFVDDLRAGDEMEIIKFDTNFQVVQGFTSDKTALKSAISAPFDLGIYTRLYDTVYEAVTNAGGTLTARRAVIVITDGVDDDGTGNPLSTRTLPEVTAHAASLGVPIFTIGLGDASRTIVNEAILTQMADDTGGQFFGSIGSDNLRTIYQQLSSIIFENQYVLQFNQSPLGAGTAATLTIGVTSQGITGNDTKQITSCN
jgi:Ca-activated chloride channel family protein